MKPQLLVVALAVVCTSTDVRAEPSREPVDNILCRGMSAVGFSYAWGGECWCASGCAPDLGSCSAGSCSGNCPSCTHSGAYGADCSGFVSRAWQVPSPIPVNSCNTDRYVASSFTSDHAYWDPVSVSSLRPGDAAASSSHVFLIVGARDGAGDYDVVEARGCSYGIVHRRRATSGYVGARRINISECTCGEGAVETRNCGDCGTQERSCDDGCSWSAWSGCEGPDPTGPDSSCTIEGASGACAVGQQLCVAGWATCQPPAATTEVCDGLDNDCDGVVDNGTPETLGEGFTCTNDCGVGESHCIEGAVRCVTPGTTWPDEFCDGDDGGPIDGGPLDGGPLDGGSDDGGVLDSGLPFDSGIPGRAEVGLQGGCACRAASVAKVPPLGAGVALLLVLALLRRRVPWRTQKSANKPA